MARSEREGRTIQGVLGYRGNMPLKRTPATILTCFGLLGSGTYGEVWTVDDDGPADFETIQEAIDASANGDRIEIRAGTYLVPELGPDPLAHMESRDLELVGVDGRELTILDAQSNAPVITLFGWDGIGDDGLFSARLKISGVTIRNGAGGGIQAYAYNEGPGIELLVDDCIIENCREPGIWMGGVIRRLEVRRSVIRDNDSTYLSGGICTDESDFLLIEQCIFTGNYSDTMGGALRLWGAYQKPSLIEIRDCIFENNIASQGAAISGNHIELEIVGTRFARNSGGQGTALFIPYDSAASISGSYFCENGPQQFEGEWVDLGDNHFESSCNPSPPCPGDIDLNWDRNGADLARMLAVWGACSECQEDLNADGVVDGTDLAFLIAYWGPC